MYGAKYGTAGAPSGSLLMRCAIGALTCVCALAAPLPFKGHGKEIVVRNQGEFIKTGHGYLDTDDCGALDFAKTCENVR